MMNVFSLLCVAHSYSGRTGRSVSYNSSTNFHIFSEWTPYYQLSRYRYNTLYLRQQKSHTWEIFNCHHSKCRNGEAFTRNILYSFPKATNVGQTHIWNLPSHWWKTGLVNKNFGLPSPRCIHLRTEVSFPLLAALLRMHEHTHITQAPAKQSNGVDIQHTPLPTPYSNRPLRNPHFHTFFASPQRFLWPCFHYRNQ